MSTPARKRLVRDFRRIQQDPPHGVSASPNPENILNWKAVIFGPTNTPWEGGTFKLTLDFTEEYPNRAPSVKFVSNVFHPNVYSDGAICLDILQNMWSPIYDVAAILTSIQSLLSDPNPASPANCNAARLYTSNRRAYNKEVRKWVEASWMEKMSVTAARVATEHGEAEGPRSSRASTLTASSSGSAALIGHNPATRATAAAASNRASGSRPSPASAAQPTTARLPSTGGGTTSSLAAGTSRSSSAVAASEVVIIDDLKPNNPAAPSSSSLKRRAESQVVVIDD